MQWNDELINIVLRHWHKAGENGLAGLQSFVLTSDLRRDP
jgi:hypothetical protein